jgi:hypothetical protein
MDKNQSLQVSDSLKLQVAVHDSAYLFHEFEHNSLLHDRGVEQQDEHKDSLANNKKSTAFGKSFIGKPVKTLNKRGNTPNNFLTIFDEEKELKARFKARHI